MRAWHVQVVLVVAVVAAVGALTFWPAGLRSKHAQASAHLVTLHEAPAPGLTPRVDVKPSTQPMTVTNSMAVTNSFLAAYSSSPSVNRGGSIAFAVSTSSRTYAVDVQRYAPVSGWVEDMTVRGGLPGRDQGHWVRGSFGVRHCPTCVISSRTGEIDPDWSWTYVLHVPASWPSGIYRAVFSSDTAADAVPFVVRADGDQAALLVVLSFNTYEAYNDWGGKSLYAFNSFGPRTVAGSTEAVAVTFQRPFAKWTPTGSPVIGYGTASDWRFAVWLEQHHVPAGYVTDVDVAANPGLLGGHRAIVFPGHSEYWSQAEYQAALGARDAGESLAFLGGNDVYWRARYDPAYRVLIEYRTPRLDPLNGDRSQVTGLFNSPEIGEPQSELTGMLYESGVPSAGVPWTTTGSAPAWLLQASGLSPGQSVQHAVSGECDRYYPDAPQPHGVSVVAQSTFLDGRAVCSSVLYRAAGGAWVFAAGDMDWDLHLLDGGPIAKVTWNLLQTLL